MYTLGIETSCDETSCAILKDYKVLSNVTISSLKEHRKYGGVVPEIATRAHLKSIDKVLLGALATAGISLGKIELVAATYKPGLIGSLVVGVNFAKALSYSLKKPFIGVNHLHAHIFAPFLNNEEKLKFPLLGLVVSGGHSEIYYVKDFDKIKLIGQTQDDACGEVFDKIAKAYSLGYPGGPAIDKLFDARYKDYFKFKCGRNRLNLSFSGIKTALIYKKMEFEKNNLLDKNTKIKLLSSFQGASIEAIVSAILEAQAQYKLKVVACGGGVMANSYLRKRLKESENQGIRFLIPPIGYTADNAAIVAGLGFYLYNKKGKTSGLMLDAQAN
ncbi:MAG: tRNA (adenosine(37)-N6)-threonylcarbamoyltransferase complex transferase subunit TsaD [Candidatus Omnitrophica bacterium]|jgi:N6-L-threonylcarbamoyladenine synthase|nr:tRNA (adenosine(37)-N6)-threonylcarbamoyltransferase complex transferase subunit TsaD [Candidatus Omnitrophota bacterium]